MAKSTVHAAAKFRACAVISEHIARGKFTLSGDDTLFVYYEAAMHSLRALPMLPLRVSRCCALSWRSPQRSFGMLKSAPRGLDFTSFGLTGLGVNSLLDFRSVRPVK